MNIILKRLALTNFKGIRNLTIDFTPTVTTISGDNGTGKTTIADAFSFLLFGKDSKDSKDFNIKTLDGENNALHKLDHEVTGVFEIDGIEQTFRKCYREKWVKKKGAEESEMAGHETLQWLNDVPLSAGEYKAKVDAIIQEEKMKLLTNPLYFNGLKWETRRRVLLGIAGEIDNTEVMDKIATIDNKQDVANLTAILNQNKSIEEYKREISAKKKRFKDELDAIPTRIDEANRSMPEVVNYAAVQTEIDGRAKEVESIDADIENRNDAFKNELAEIQKRQQEKHNLQTHYNNLVNAGSLERNKEANGIDNKINLTTQAIQSLKNNIESNTQDISRKNNATNQLRAANDTIREQWTKENARELVIDESSLNCPTCGQQLPEEKLATKRETLTKNFNDDKKNNLDRIDSQGIANKKTIESNEEYVKGVQKLIDDLKSQLTVKENELTELQTQKEGVANKASEPTVEEIEMKAKLDAFIIPEAPQVDITDLKSRKSILASEIDELKSKLASKTTIDNLNRRIEELEKQEKELAQHIATLERTEFTITAFTKCKMDTLEQRINGMFDGNVRFKTYSSLINGGQEDACECLVNGVNFSDVNNAGKINAGIAIINVLSDYYKCYAPIFVDNAESINEILPLKSQLIRLVVSLDKQLVIS